MQQNVDQQIVSIETVRNASTADKIPTARLYVPQFGGDIVVRGLTLGDNLHAAAAATRYVRGKKQPVDEQLQQRHILLRGVAQPALTIADLGLIDQWSMETVKLVLGRIMELSGFEVKELTLRQRIEAIVQDYPADGTVEAFRQELQDALDQQDDAGQEGPATKDFSPAPAAP